MKINPVMIAARSHGESIMRYSAFSVFLNALRGNKSWQPAWRSPLV